MNLEEISQRKKVILDSLKNLQELIQSRNHVLFCFEKSIFHKVTNDVFTRLNTTSKGTMINAMLLIKKNNELDLKLFRRAIFYLRRRKQYLEKELNELETLAQELKSKEISTNQSDRVDSEDPSQSA